MPYLSTESSLAYAARGPPKDDCGAEEADCRTGKIPAVRAHTFDRPQSQQGRSDVNATISSIGPPDKVGINTG